MYLDKVRFRRNGEFSFIYYDKYLGKNRRLGKAQVPSWVQTLEDAERFCRNHEAEGEATKLRVQLREAWKTKYHDFSELLVKYVEDRKSAAPNSWENDLYYLEQYVLHFFLEIADSNSIQGWPNHFSAFKKWLRSVKPLKGSKPTLAISTQNHCIKALNTFLSFAYQEHQITLTEKCPVHPRRLIRRKDIESVISDEERKAVGRELRKIDDLYADKYEVALDTGLRDAELDGISIGDVSPGEPPQEHIRCLLKKNGMNCLGYITLRDQLVDNHQRRDANGQVFRKPLKHKKKVSAKDTRIIPLTNVVTYNILVKRFKEKQKLYERKAFGPDKRNYLLFDGVSTGRYRLKLIEAHKRAGFKYHSPHDARHTFATKLAGRSGGDWMLCKLVLGHKDIETTQGYLHIFELLISELANQEVIETGLDFLPTGNGQEAIS